MDDSPKKTLGDSGLAPGERPTLKTISQMTGLAVATVSRALHDAPDIGRDTKKRVQETAKLIGYLPNRAGVRLRTGKTNVVSMILSTEHDVMNHTARLIASVAGELRHTPYHLIVTPYFPSEDPMKMVRYIVETHSADAVILNQIEPEDERVKYLMEHNFPFATHGRSNQCDAYPYYDFDNTRFAEIGIEQLAGHGRRSILLVAPPLQQNYAQNIVMGAQSKARELGMETHVLAGVTSDSPGNEIEAVTKAYLEENPNIDGILCASTTAAMAVVTSAEECGREIGKDLDVFAKEAIPFLKRFRKPILVAHEDVTTAGTFLARAVLQRISHPDMPPMQDLETPSF